MIERRDHRRVPVGYCVNLRHPLLGVLTAEANNLSIGGLAITLDEEINCFVMMEFDIEVQGDGWQDETPTLPVQVTRVKGREIALKFLEVNSVQRAEDSSLTRTVNSQSEQQPEPQASAEVLDLQPEAQRTLKIGDKERYRFQSRESRENSSATNTVQPRLSLHS